MSDDTFAFWRRGIQTSTVRFEEQQEYMDERVQHEANKREAACCCAECAWLRARGQP